MNVLLVGGAGYIGSHMLQLLLQTGHSVVTLDNLSSGYRDAVKGGDFVYGDIANSKVLDDLFSRNVFDAVFHFASYIQVGESVLKPDIYYQNNFVNTVNLLNAMVRHGVSNFIFSSTAAIFGEPEYQPIDEMHPLRAVNPYGKSKLMVEQALEDYDKAFGLKSVCLRYFNAAGAHPDALIGERHLPETHLIPLILQVAAGRRESISVYGRDYPTADGTCVRDFIHVMDLCDAHLLALEQLVHRNQSSSYNLGNGNGFSVQEVIDMAECVTGKTIKTVDANRRGGDSAQLVSDSSLAKDKLCWKPKYADLETIIKHAWQWELKANEWASGSL